MKAKLNKTVYIIGFMGAGKTTLARRLAKTCSCVSVDVDFYIERMCGKKIRKIFKDEGEEFFRQLETDALIKISETEQKRFVSCGGGVVLRQNNVDIMKKSGVVLHLYSDGQNGAKRISNKKTRPLFSDVKQAQELFFSRLPLYENAADLTIDTTSKSSGRVFHETIELLKNNNIISVKDQN